MRKLKLQVQTSVDGYVCGPNGEMDWMEWNWDDELKAHVGALTDSSDTILLGRKMATGFMAHWSGVVGNPTDPAYEFGKKMMDTHKVVFTKTLEKSEWENTVLAKGDLAEEIAKLKSQDGKDIIVYGGASFDAALIKAGLIDELHLFVNHVAIGAGMPIFAGRTNLRLVTAQSFKCGIVELVYQPQD